MTAPKESIVQVTYTSTLEGVTPDVESNVLRGVKLLGMESVNGRDYTPDALRNAIPLYEGIKACRDHPEKPHDRRSYGEKLGRFKNVSYLENKGIFGDLHLNPENPTSKELLWDAKNDPTSCGFSHNADLRVRRQSSPKRGGRARMVVEGIAKVRTVDLVFDPATTVGVFEHSTPEDTEMPDITELSLEEIKNARPDLVTELEADVRSSLEQTDAAAEMEAIRKENEALKAKEAKRERATAVAAELEAAELNVTDETSNDLKAYLEGIECKKQRGSAIDLLKRVATETIEATESAEATRRSSAPRANPPASQKDGESNAVMTLGESLAKADK